MGRALEQEEAETGPEGTQHGAPKQEAAEAETGLEGTQRRAPKQEAADAETGLGGAQQRAPTAAQCAPKLEVAELEVVAVAGPEVALGWGRRV